MNTDNRPLAVVTGASRGIGRELARQFAEHGHDVVMAADSDLIHEAATEVGGTGCRTYPVQVDLATPSGVEELHRTIVELGRPVDVLALNAGVGLGGQFVESDLERELQVVDLDVRSTVHLARLVLPQMVARRSGRVLVTSSVASTMPGSYEAVYNASKSFVQSFALALRDELKDSGVTVTSLMPGPTDTNFFARANMLRTKVGMGRKDDPAHVAKDGYEGLVAGKERVVPGSIRNDIQGRVGRLVPDRVKAALHRAMARPRPAATH